MEGAAIAIAHGLVQEARRGPAPIVKGKRLTMKRLRIGESVWLDHTPPPPTYPPLRGRHDADVAVVGGGITGTACAYLLARAGARVVLVDAGRIGRGSTAASTALLMQEPHVDFDDFGARYGTTTAATIWRCGRRTVHSLVRTLRRLRGSTEVRTPSTGGPIGRIDCSRSIAGSVRRAEL